MAAINKTSVRRKSIFSHPADTKARLRKLIVGCFVLIALPIAFVIYRAYTELDHATLYRYRVSSEEVLAQLNQRLFELLKPEEDRPFDDYHFFKVADGQRGVFEVSPLSSLSATDKVPGLVGYFQIGPDGALSSPIVPEAIPPSADPASLGITYSELQIRIERRHQLSEILASTRLGDREVDAAPLKDGHAQGQVAETSGSNRKRDQTEQLEQQAGKFFPNTANNATQLLEQRASRKSMVSVFEKQERLSPKVTQFEAEIEPFQVMFLPKEKLAFFRRVWRDNQRFIQGFVVNRNQLFQFLAGASFYTNALSAESVLTLRHSGRVLARYDPIPSEDRAGRVSKAATNEGIVFAKAFLSPPLNELELVFSTGALQPAVGRTSLHLMTTLICLVLIGGLVSVYRLAVGQIELAAERSDFVSAVSHELKTPLTSIRMYAEMLQSGIAVDPVKLGAYLQYILSESERLSRLISNVLQLARLSRGTNGSTRSQGDVPTFSAVELLEVARLKIESQTQAAGFKLEVLTSSDASKLRIRAEEDAFIQILINLADNAIKFSSGCTRKVVQLKLDVYRDKATVRELRVVFSVRDYGPGIHKDEITRIFQPFYRVEDELTRKTTGTGIGLALVRELANSLNGEVGVRNADPGAEFQLILPAA